MPICRSCGKKANSMNFCSDCGTSAYVVSDSQYQTFLRKSASQTKNNTFRKIKKNINYRKSSSKKNNTLVCDICFSKFSNELYLIHHKKTEHNDPSAEEGTPFMKKFPRFKCKICSKRFPTESALTQHQKMKHNGASAKEEAVDNKFICEICSNKFRTADGLIQHKKAKHDEPSVDKKEKYEKPSVDEVVVNKKFICVRCFSRFESQYSLTQHQILLHYKSFDIGAVAKQCRNREDIHNKIQLSSECFICKHCGKQYSTKKRLVEHRNSFLCKYCEKEYPTKKHLLEHINEDYPFLLGYTDWNQA
ncbi:C2H2-type zinc finger protein [Methanolobus sp.]|uniref:C2H2-type zinc finger protein n=1 Tax=Methanolobus sp. TaxID=1874737 RepID=UPI0025FCADA6|nr:C2H2-type zinc finger protein [Methanolobus sp.]